MTLKYIKSDLYRYTGHVSFKTFFKTYFFNRGFNFSFWLRLASSKTVWAKLAYPIYYYKKSSTALIFIPRLKLATACLLGMAGRWSSIRQP